MTLALENGQAVVVRADAASEEVVALQEQVVRGDGGGQIVGGGLYVGGAVFGGDVFQDDAIRAGRGAAAPGCVR